MSSKDLQEILAICYGATRTIVEEQFVNFHELHYKVNDLAFAEDIAPLENNSTQAQQQLGKLEHEANKIV